MVVRLDRGQRLDSDERVCRRRVEPHSDARRQGRTLGAFRVVTVWINCFNIFDAALPFGGYKQSGWGREMGHEALDLYTETKAICIGL